MTIKEILNQTKEMILEQNLFWERYTSPQINPRKEIENADCLYNLILVIGDWEKYGYADYIFNSERGYWQRIYLNSGWMPDILYPKMLRDGLNFKIYRVIYGWNEPNIPERYTDEVCNLVREIRGYSK